ncbi:sigma factor-like helix-turn-helix DNA-binding protein [Bradyrhizobium lablabi]|uniref:Sigma-70, region 4 n=1 Tax=Bradyrhizobium lablabi TaxID=722472 RepID=A0A1H5JIX1_9BRAD|nr:sigma factor-like helix-turn-helix DNA-binding protein [Bradyrhizobium lablabi]SEE52409.1 Sigma-70, region 4 [Bradyrhizobium lablabi]SEE79445.1 Sigma-70, region 4 [Bradyrhizobium lablabi]
MSHKSEYEGKSDRALKLKEQGLTMAQIAERLNVRSVNVASMLNRARERREKAAAWGRAEA